MRRSTTLTYVTFRQSRLMTQATTLAMVLLVLGGGGCTCPAPPTPSVPFAFRTDTFAFANQLRWEYGFDAAGRWVGKRRQPPPDYSNHCFVLTQGVKQFFWNARFAPELPKTDDETYARLVRRVLGSSPRKPVAPKDRIVIPGYSNLYEFSRDFESLIKRATGGGWKSYVQRGHWRMIFPFSKHHQFNTALRLAKAARRGSPVVVHLVDFPGLKINHAIVVFHLEETRDKLFFEAYDPNAPTRACVLTYDLRAETFRYPVSNYFPGGRIKVYEVYCGAWY